MKLINFKDPKQFRELEKDAFDGKLDVEDFPAAEYRYFDRVAQLGYRIGTGLQSCLWIFAGSCGSKRIRIMLLTARSWTHRKNIMHGVRPLY